MKTTKRFENAVSKLYNAFHENRLNANDCSACAVGNMCDNDSSWIGQVNLGYFQHEEEKHMYLNMDADFPIKQTGYTCSEIAEIEYRFIKGHNPDDGVAEWKNKELQFNGLCYVIEYLCELDNIPNIMDYKSLFETENEHPKRELIEVFI